MGQRIEASEERTEKGHAIRDGSFQGQPARQPGQGIGGVSIFPGGAGNLALLRMLQSGIFQAKLKIGGSRDSREAEADRMAADTVGMVQAAGMKYG